MSKKDVMNKMIADSLDPSLIDYIRKSLENFSGTKAEFAIAIYIKLAELFWYDSKFVVDNDLSIIDELSAISVSNNEVICLHWAIIYYKLLDIYGIESKLLGNDEHLMVKVITEDFILYTDATRYGIGNRNYQLADLTNLKLKLKIEGIYILNEHLNEKLEQTINLVYEKLGIEVFDSEKINTLLERYRMYCCKRLSTKKEMGLNRIDKPEILKRIRFLNFFYKLKINLREVERLQIFSKYYKNVFEGFDFDNCRCITMSEQNSAELHLVRLIILADDLDNIYYFLESPNGFIEYTKEALLDEFVIRNIRFKYEISSVLGFCDNEVKMLSKKPK